MTWCATATRPMWTAAGCAQRAATVRPAQKTAPASAVCTDGRCAAPACADGVQNGDETDVDCGGSCGACAEGDACAAPADCASLICRNGQRRLPPVSTKCATATRPM